MKRSSIKKCNICGIMYIPNSGVQKACSNECQRTSRLQTRKQWRDDNKESHNNTKRLWAKKNKKLITKLNEEFRLKNKAHIKIYNKIYNSENKIKTKAHNLIHAHKKKYPELYSCECMICGITENVQQHHPIYSLPYLVYPLCVSHHKQLHQNEVNN